ncbi:MAG: FAD:protein FMN transferase [Lachnospiraceae bacterium]|nr:FAD:protein FMN transferase [Lachnospiraceae bacterium]
MRKKHYTKLNSIIKITLFVLCLLLVTGCAKYKSPVSKSGVYFDTLISVTLYEKNSSKLIDECFLLAEKYENLFSKTKEGSDVYKVNHSNSKWVKLDSETYSLIKRSLYYEDLSGGRFSVMCGALTELWDINAKSDAINNGKSISLPTSAKISSARSLCGKDTIELDDSTESIRITVNGAKLDLGAVAKGYIADKIKEFLISNGVTSGIIELGGNVLLIGENPLKEDRFYNIGISAPFSDDKEPTDIITSVKEKDTSIVTSGNYQRYFEYDGKIYHHIIDITTGYPVDNALNSVSVITKSSLDADALSTVLFLLGKEKGVKLLDSLSSNNDYSAIFIDNENNITFYPQTESLP